MKNMKKNFDNECEIYEDEIEKLKGILDLKN